MPDASERTHRHTHCLIVATKLASRSLWMGVFAAWAWCSSSADASAVAVATPGRSCGPHAVRTRCTFVDAFYMKFIRF